MSTTVNCLRWSWLALLLVAPACTSNGEFGWGADCRDISKGAIPQPAGTHLCQWTNVEVSRAEADIFVIYQYEWIESKLGPFGKRHIAALAMRLQMIPSAIIVEPSSDRELDEKRRVAVVQGLAECGVEIPLERVVLGRWNAEGLEGFDVQLIGNELVYRQNQAATGGAGALRGGNFQGGGGIYQGSGGVSDGGFGGVVVPLGGGMGSY